MGGHLVSLREQQKGRPAQISTDSQYRKEENGITMEGLMCKAGVRKAWRLTNRRRIRHWRVSAAADRLWRGYCTSLNDLFATITQVKRHVNLDTWSKHRLKYPAPLIVGRPNEPSIFPSLHRNKATTTHTFSTDRTE